MSVRRVAVSGVGVVSPQGIGRDPCWQALVDGRSAIAPLPEELTRGRLRFANGARVRGFRPEEEFDAETLQISDRFSQFALLAATEAIADAGVDWSDELRRHTAIVTGSCVGGQSTEDAAFERLYGDGAKRVPPFSIPRIMANSAASLISMRFGLTGPAFTLSTACSSANHALGQALWMVREGRAELAVAGGSEAPFSYGNLKAWEAMRVVSRDTCRPFSADRDGMILGEGAAFFVLEPLDRAEARGAAVYAELAGCGMSADAHHITQPSVEGPVAAMRQALEDGAVEREQVGYVNAHGTGTRANDSAEAAAIRRLFGAHAERLAVSSTKSMHGHALGAAGALEAFATVMALRHGILPPTANHRETDPDCDLDVIPNKARKAEVAAALSSSFAFGGLNAVLAFRRAGAAPRRQQTRAHRQP